MEKDKAMTIHEFKKWILTTEASYRYQLLDRMKSDCLYFLGYGAGGSRLWGGTINEHIEFMQMLYGLLAEKPEWLTIEEIKQFKHDMNKKSAN